MNSFAGLMTSRWWLRLPLLGLAGLVTSVGFAPWQLWPAAIVGPAAFFLILRSSRRGLSSGYVFGLGFYGGLVSWIGVLGWYAAVGLIALMAIHPMLVGWGVQVVRRLPWWPLWTAACWLLGEFTAARFPFGGFSWGRLAWSTPDQPLAGWLAWIGASGVSLLCALTAALLTRRAEQPRARWGAEVAMAMVFALGAGSLALTRPLSAGAGSVTIGMVQGNVDGTAGSQAMGYARSVTNNHLSQTITLMARARTGVDPKPDFVLWPENATDIDPRVDADTQTMINQAQQLAGVPMFIGIVAFGPGPDERQTSGLWWDRAGAGERYDKRNLVPFGEYVPYRSVLLPRFPILQQVGAQGIPGTKPGVTSHQVAGRTLRVGDAICFELAYDTTMYDMARLAPDVAVVQSNNATYTGTGQPLQQFEITRVRALELRRELVVATTSSFSGLIDARGRELARTQEATAAAHSWTIPLRTGVSAGVVVGPWLELGAALIAVAAMVVGAVRRTGSRPE